MYRKRYHFALFASKRIENVADNPCHAEPLSVMTSSQTHPHHERQLAAYLCPLSSSQNDHRTLEPNTYVTRYHMIFRIYQDSPVPPIQWVSGRLSVHGFAMYCETQQKLHRNHPCERLLECAPYSFGSFCKHPYLSHPKPRTPTLSS